MRRLFFIALAAAATILAACETVAPPPPPPPVMPRPSADTFRSADFSWSAIPGPDRVDGRIGYRQGPTAFVCTNAILMPETPWSARRMSILYRSTVSAAVPAAEVRSRTPPAPRELDGFVKQTTCDPLGHFSFGGLPDGSWFVITVVRPVDGPAEQIALMRRVVTTGGRTTAVDL